MSVTSPRKAATAVVKKTRMAALNAAILLKIYRER